MSVYAKYILITPAKNEEKNIEKTIDSIINQTIRPIQWIIISDGSTDRTDDIVCQKILKYNFITFRRLDRALPAKNYSRKVEAIKYGLKLIKHNDYNYIGNLDADVSFGNNYFESVLKVMEEYKNIGIAGGWIYQVDDGKVRPFLISNNSVSGAVQLFRRECYEQIGGYLPISIGGVDSAAEIMAREKRWEVRTLRELIVLHHGKMLTGNKNLLQASFKKGCLNYILGYHPLFQMASCLFRILEPPFIIGSICNMAGYMYSFLKKTQIVFSESTVIFLRKEQMKRLCDLLSSKKGDSDF